MAEQIRRPERKKFLDASLVPMENALLQRAAILESRSASPGLNRVLAFEFRELAEELHHW